MFIFFNLGQGVELGPQNCRSSLLNWTIHYVYIFSNLMLSNLLFMYLNHA